ncbi:MAG: hypothetical protein ACXADF_18335 [Candidatus Thorarchaeota archaeon]|jgi:hypothetical protein
MTISEMIAIVATIVGLMTLMFGLYKYSIAQRWKRSEFAGNQLMLLSTDRELELCCKFLDWSAFRFTVPEKYHDVATEKTYVHKYSILYVAMRPEEEQEVFPGLTYVYRDLFDRFFTYLERINHFIDIKLISVDDVRSLEYLLKEVLSPRFAHKGQEDLFHDFLKRYEYDGVFELMKKFNIRLPTQA